MIYLKGRSWLIGHVRLRPHPVTLLSFWCTSNHPQNTLYDPQSVLSFHVRIPRGQSWEERRRLPIYLTFLISYRIKLLMHSPTTASASELIFLGDAVKGSFVQASESHHFKIQDMKQHISFKRITHPQLHRKLNFSFTFQHSRSFIAQSLHRRK